MAEKNKQEMDIFVRRILACFKEKRLTVEEVRSIYLGFYPQSLIEKTLHLAPVSVDKVRKALSWLFLEGFIHKEFVIFLDYGPLDKDTYVFWISNTGRSYLHRKK
jgi:hypothetical protein